MNFSRIILPILVVGLLGKPSFAQKKQFTMAEATNGMATTLAPKNIKSPGWQPGSEVFWQADAHNDADAWKLTDLSRTGADQVSYIVPGTLPEGVKVTGLPPIKWQDHDNVWFQSDKNIVVGSLATSRFNWNILTTLPEKAENVTYDKSGKVAYTLENNLYLYTHENNKTKLTFETNANVLCGRSVHREEFGIDKGIFFSPKGNLVAYYRMDQTMVKDYPIIKWDATPATTDIIKYPMAGDVSHEVTVCVYNVSTGKTAVLRTGERHKDHYLTSVTWAPDEKSIYVAILSREQNHLLLNQYDAATGEKIKTLFEETDKKYVHPTHPLYFIPGTDNEFIWWSQRDGYEHLYLYNIDGQMIRQLTKGNWVVNEIVGYNKAEDKLIITSSKESPLEKHIYSVTLETGAIARIDKGAGMHAASCSDNGKYIYDVYNGAGVPRSAYLRNVSGGFSLEVLKAPNTLADYDRPEIRNVKVMAADGVTPLYGKLILPTNFDSTKKYPMIVYLYNGPNVQLIHNQFPESGNLWYEYMAQHGYIVFTMDGRGSWNRGLAFEQATFRNLGEAEMNDQLKGVEYLKKLPYVDEERMGVHGWSFGGFMTTSLMLKHPDVFKVGVAGGPVMDWRMYEIMYTERYMDMPSDNPEGYAKANLLDKVKNLKGKLLLIHGTNDNVVVWQHSINFIKRSVDEGVQVDYFVYPGHEHNVRGKDRVHLMQKITNYFDDYLKK